MILQRYDQQGLLFNSNFTEPAGTPGSYAYRGDLVLVEGEIGDASGRRKPPVATMRQAVLLAEGDKLKLVSGLLEDIARLPVLIERYAADFAPDVSILLFVANIPKPVQLVLDGARYALLPLEDGMVWNELLDELCLEKSELKGQSAGEKVATVGAAMKAYKSKGNEVEMAAALADTIEVKRGGRGPV